MKSWLAKTLLWSAIALVVFAGLWMVLDSKWSGDLEALRARRAAQGLALDAADLLPPLDPGADAGPECCEVFARLRSWSWDPAVLAAFERADNSLGELRNSPERWTAEQAEAYSFCDSAALREILEEARALLLREHCRLQDRSEGGSMHGVHPGYFLFDSMLERECFRELLRGNAARAAALVECAFAYAAHLREVPLLSACDESDAMFMRAAGMLRASAARGELDAALARRLLPWLVRIRPKEDWLRAFDGERVLFGDYAWAGLRDGRAPDGVGHPVDPLGLLYTRLLRPWRLLEELKYEQVLDERHAAVAAQPWVKHDPPRIPSLLPLVRSLTTREGLDGERRLRVQRARDQCELALLLVIVRAEVGAYPATLDALGELPREPLTGEPYAFTRAGEGYTLALPPGCDDTTAPWSVHR